MKKFRQYFLLSFVFVVIRLILLPSLYAMDIPNGNVIYKSNIRTVQLYKEGFELSSPVITLNSTEKVKLSFDDLDGGNKRYRFTIQHCEADWTTSTGVSASDYIDGYREENIDDYAYSYNTTVIYTHYTALFPTRSMRPRLSGNYLLVVYEEDPSNIVLTRRFLVAETTPVGITGKVSQSARMDMRNSGQQIDFTVNLNGFRVSGIRLELNVVIQQNERWDNVLRNIKPRFIRGDEIDYTYDENNLFSGGNEFRNFDTKSLAYQSERIKRILFDTTSQVYLLEDQPRPLKNYTFEKDLNGRFYIKNEENAVNSDIEADYAWIHFFLSYPVMRSDGQMVILGALTNWQPDAGSRMTYSFTRRGYWLNLFLKQGYYNYEYVFILNGRNTGDESLTEGSHWETENEYTIYVYYHEAGGLYDRLIATQDLNSIVR